MKSTKLLALALTLTVLSSAALAANPVNWSFSNLVAFNGQPAHWDSGTSYIDDMPLYNYTFTITKLEVGVDVLGMGNPDLYTYFDVTPDPDPTSSGQAAGGLPTIFTNDHYDQTAGEMNVQADVIAGLTDLGQGYVDVENLVITGQFGGFDVESLRLSGTLDATGVVPEPCTMALLGVAGVGLVVRKRRRK